MRIFDNPFYLLNISPCSDKSEIFDAADELELQNDDPKAGEYAAALVDPIKRIAAEVSYFPDADEDDHELCRNYLARIEQGQCDDDTYEEIYEELEYFPCSLFNVETALLEKLRRLPTVGILPELCAKFDEIDWDDIKTCINEDRQAAGITALTDLSLIRKETEAVRFEFVKACCAAFNELKTMEMVEKFIKITDAATKNGKDLAPSLIYDLVDHYEKNTQAFFENNTPVIRQMIEAVRKAAAAGETEEQILRRLDKLIENIKLWDKIAEPMQLARASRGEEHEMSRELAFSFRSLGVDLFNKHEYIAAAERVIEAVEDIFGNLSSVVGSLANDKKALQDIKALAALKQAADRLKEAEPPGAFREAAAGQREAEPRAFAEDMRYFATVGSAAKDRISLTAEGIQYSGVCLRFTDIVAARWGTAVRRRAGISSCDHVLAAEDVKGNKLNIDFTDRFAEDDTFENITSRFWQGAADIIIPRLVQAIAVKGIEGEQIKIADEGAWFSRSGLWDRKPPVFVPWSAVDFDDHDGCMILAGGGETASLSFRDQWNVYYLYAIISIAKKAGFPRLSMIMEQYNGRQ